MTGKQKEDSTTVATITLVDDDAATEGVDHYIVFVGLNVAPGTNQLSDKYQIVASAGKRDIDLSSLINGDLTPDDGDHVYFTVVAVDDADHVSNPTGNDSTMIVWDKAGPGKPTGLTFVDNPGMNTMTYSWNDQTSDDDLDHFEVYFNNGSEATPENNGVKKTYESNYRGNNLVRGVGKILDLLDVKEGDEIHITVYAVDRFGNRSEPAKISAIYSLVN
ncbi:hypothetical protein [Brevibacillus reuszeri]|uniref:hypothetical protein n=1 Tax=Brevibacillus reuszeri TaxID=54915 RepID=UPI0028A0235D|nr:hypothetical protein [Brevibacillus reuszeri]